MIIIIFAVGSLISTGKFCPSSVESTDVGADWACQQDVNPAGFLVYFHLCVGDTAMAVSNLEDSDIFEAMARGVLCQEKSAFLIVNFAGEHMLYL